LFASVSVSVQRWCFASGACARSSAAWPIPTSTFQLSSPGSVVLALLSAALIVFGQASEAQPSFPLRWSCGVESSGCVRSLFARPAAISFLQFILGVKIDQAGFIFPLSCSVQRLGFFLFAFVLVLLVESCDPSPRSARACDLVSILFSASAPANPHHHCF
jgi:hypothetical protein